VTQEPVALEPIMQLGTHDCGVAGIAMLLGVPYVAIAGALPQRKRVYREGMSTRQMVNLAKSLGRKVKVLKTVDLSDDFGILQVENDKEEHGHAAMLWRGLIVDPASGFIWDSTVWLERGGWKPDVLITLDEEG
jgi:hypothetical protein